MTVSQMHLKIGLNGAKNVRIPVTQLTEKWCNKFKREADWKVGGSGWWNEASGASVGTSANWQNLGVRNSGTEEIGLISAKRKVNFHNQQCNAECTEKRHSTEINLKYIAAFASWHAESQQNSKVKNWAQQKPLQNQELQMNLLQIQESKIFSTLKILWVPTISSIWCPQVTHCTHHIAIKPEPIQ